MIIHKNYRARVIEESDLDFVTSLRTSKFVQENVGNFLFTNRISQIEWLKSISKSDSQSFLIFEFCKNGHDYERIGMIRFSSIDRVHKNMCVGGDIMQSYSGQGHGKFMYELIFEIGFNIWAMHRLWLFVLSNNERAISLYEKMGFIHEGKQREAVFKDGKYVDYLMMSILEGEYRSISKTKS